MNRDRDFDQTLTRWLEDGAERAPERHVWAALEKVDRTGQRGTWGAWLEANAMQLKPAALILSVAALAVLAIALYLGLASETGTTEPGPSATITPSASVDASPSPVGRLITLADLPDIVLTDQRVPIEWERGDATEHDPLDLLVYPTRSAQATEAARDEVAAVLGGIATEFSGPPDAAYICWALVFRTEADAQRVVAIYVDDFTSPQGWGLERTSTGDHDGIEGAVYEGLTSRFLGGSTGSEPVPANIRLWRVKNLLLALGSFFDYDSSGGTHLLGDNMVGRARRAAAGEAP